MTHDQLALLAADIAADPALAAQPMTPDGAVVIADAYNAPADPAYTVWRTAASITELQGPGFDWTRVDNLTVGKARIWTFLTATNVINLSQPNVRQGIEACYSVEATDAPCRQSIYTGGSRLATRGEHLYASGTGAPPDHHGVGPGTMSFEGAISHQDVQQARELGG